MRKNAKQYSRQLESKSGELDCRSLAKYRFTNDIFRKVTETPKGKSHGMVMFVDMSSSMSDMLRNTFEQAIILGMFCNKVGIPFAIYGFSDNSAEYDMVSYMGKKFTPKTISAFDLPNTNFHLKTLLSSDLNTRDFQRAAAMMITFATTYNYYKTTDNADIEAITKSVRPSMDIAHLGLSGTPFVETLVASKPIINQFKSKTHVDIVNVVYLTDGEGGLGISMPELYRQYYVGGPDINVGFVDPATKMRVMVKQTGNGNRYQAALTELIRQSTDCRHIGFYIANLHVQTRQAADMSDDAEVVKKLKKSLKEDGYFMYPNLGYDSYYYIVIRSGGVKDETLSENTRNLTKSELQKAFDNVQQKKHSNRALVASFAQEIAA